MATYNQSHRSTLYQSHQHQKPAYDPPSTLALLLATRQHDDESDQGHALDDDGKGHEEADGAPHVAEVSIFAMALGFFREFCAAVSDGVAQRMKPVIVADWVTRVLEEGDVSIATERFVRGFSG